MCGSTSVGRAARTPTRKRGVALLELKAQGNASGCIRRNEAADDDPRERIWANPGAATLVRTNQDEQRRGCSREPIHRRKFKGMVRP